MAGAAKLDVDLVYLWVDAKDPTWRASYRQATGIDPGDDTKDEFRSFDELRYSLRSVERHAAFVRRIYVVTASQVPPWLKQSARLRVVDHREIFPDPAVLPVFNSQAIESHVHRIPGLSDRFLYSNDDTFFLSDVDPSYFFTASGKMIVYLQPGLLRRGVPDSAWGQSVERAFVRLERVYPGARAMKTRRWKFWREAWEWLDPKQGWSFNRISHQIRGLSKDAFARVAAAFPEEVRQVERHRFGRSEIPNFLTLLSHVEVQSGFAEARRDESSIILHPMKTLASVEETVAELEARRRAGVRLLCVNDKDSTPETFRKYQLVMKSALEALYPRPSAFER